MIWYAVLWGGGWRGYFDGIPSEPAQAMPGRARGHRDGPAKDEEEYNNRHGLVIAQNWEMR